jgi:glutamine phosphoribosylpyrophosphate amidotransferase
MCGIIGAKVKRP